MKDDFELMWRFEALRIAAMEQLTTRTVLNTDKLFRRAEIIYDLGYKEGMDKWESVWNDKLKEMDSAKGNELNQEESVAFVKEMKKTEERKPNKIEKEIIKAILPTKGYKLCVCGEEVRESWKEHKFKKDGSSCGHKF